MFSEYQSLYFAHWLTLRGRSDNQISRTMASARVDMNPHQVQAAIFALKSPVAKGVLLADEVGLGKTIEASLVMAQKWAEKKLEFTWIDKDNHPRLEPELSLLNPKLLYENIYGGCANGQS